MSSQHVDRELDRLVEEAETVWRKMNDIRESQNIAVSFNRRREADELQERHARLCDEIRQLR